MLFQPTNISPSILGETGNGVVDITQDMKVSWQVNGNSPMTAFALGIYLNDTNSTPVYISNKRFDKCPFYGTDYKGDIQPFSTTIATGLLTNARNVGFYSASGGITAVTVDYDTFGKAALYESGAYPFRYDGTNWVPTSGNVDFANAGITVTGTAAAGDTITVAYGMKNGETYKLVITQYWGNGEFVTQTAASAFKTRSLPILELDNVPDTLAARSYSFTAAYEQEQGDSIEWVRWKIALSDDLENPIVDTQNIYGTSQLRVDYGGFFTGSTYAVNCTVQTENGVEISSGWSYFPVEYSLTSLAGTLTVRRAKKANAVVIQWPQVTYIPGTATGNYSVAGGSMQLSEGSSVIWNTVNSGEMSFAPNWSLAYETRIAGENVNLLGVQTSEGRLTVNFTMPTLTVSIDDRVLFAKAPLPANSDISLILTPKKLYIRYKYSSGGLSPSETLYPDTDLYPAENTSTTENSETKDVSYIQGTIQSIETYGKQRCNYIWVTMGEMQQADISQIMSGQGFEPEYGDNEYFTADFKDDLKGGSLSQYSGALTGGALYRQEGDSKNLEYLTTMPLSTQAMMDYGARSQTAYRYYLFPSSDTVYITDAVISDPITPVFWKWSILECVEQDDGHYRLEREYDFEYNLTSGDISNNSVPTILSNFTPYPVVQTSSSLYRSGTLSSYIGTVDFANGNEYSDTISERDAIFALSQTANTLFLKNRKGDLFEIRISGAISASTADNTREQAQMISLSWVEVGDAEGAVIVGEYSGETIPTPEPTPEPSGDCITEVETVPTEKITTFIYNTTTGEYYLWRG